MSDVKRKGRPPEHDKAELLRAARAVAAERGFDSLRFTDISAATGVPVSSLQYVFGTREALVLEVLRHGVADELERLRHKIEQQADPWKRIETFIKAGISIDDDQRREGWLLWMEYWRVAFRDPELREESGVTTRAWRLLIKRAVDDGVALGHFAIDGSSEEVASALVALVDGMSLQVLVGDNRMQAPRATRTAVRAARRMLGVSIT